MLKLLLHCFESFFLVLRLSGFVEEHAVLLANQHAEKVVDVVYRVDVDVHFSVNAKSSIEIVDRLVCALNKLLWQILDLLLNRFVVSLEDNSILRQNFL